MAGFGIATGLANGQPLSTLRAALERIAAAGFTHAELSGKSLGVIINGQVMPQRLDALRAALHGIALGYTLHGTEIASARGGNLADVSAPSQRLTVEADIALARAIGATVVVYHSGMLRDPGGDGRALEAGMAAERAALRKLGDLAGEHGITIAVENRDPVGRYILRQAYGLDLARLAEQIEQVDHPNVGICFDTGHAFLASAWLGFDYLEGMRRIAPLTAHIHLSDNFGNVLLDETSDPAENLIQGLGDLHLLPGWGAVPFDAIAAIPFPRNPVSIVELRATFGEHLDEAAHAARAFATQIAPDAVIA
jgi:sugar phosphate isomerase/epimerase